MTPRKSNRPYSDRERRQVVFNPNNPTDRRLLEYLDQDWVNVSGLIKACLNHVLFGEDRPNLPGIPAQVPAQAETRIDREPPPKPEPVKPAPEPVREPEPIREEVVTVEQPPIPTPDPAPAPAVPTAQPETPPSSPEPKKKKKRRPSNMMGSFG